MQLTRFLIDLNVPPHMVQDASADAEGIREALWDYFPHLPQEAITVLAYNSLSPPPPPVISSPVRVPLSRLFSEEPSTEEEPKPVPDEPEDLRKTTYSMEIVYADMADKETALIKVFEQILGGRSMGVDRQGTRGFYWTQSTLKI